MHQRRPVKFYTVVALGIVYAKEKKNKYISKKENSSLVLSFFSGVNFLSQIRTKSSTTFSLFNVTEWNFVVVIVYC